MAVAIAARIRRSVLGVALTICVGFSVLTLLLAYVTEDRLFANQLRAEERTLLAELPDERSTWLPRNGHMTFHHRASELPPFARSIGSGSGVYEFFDEDHAWFILRGRFADGEDYFLSYDVAPFLAMRSARSDVIVTLLVALGSFSALALVMAAMVSGRILRPLNRLTSTLRLEKGGALPQGFSKEFAADEIGTLARALEDALARERAAAEREFEFNSGVSHELRTPLHAAKNALELVDLADDRIDPALKQPIARLRRAVDRMESISTAFLWLASDRNPSIDDADGQEALHRVLADLAVRGDDNIRTAVSAGVRYAMPSEVLEVVLRNLIQNALEHGDGIVHCALDADRIVIANAYHARHPRSVEGFGVGLAITRRICDRFEWNMETTIVDGRAEVAVVRERTDRNLAHR